MANPYDTGLDKTPANYQPLTPLVFLERAASVHPDHTAIIHGKPRISYARVLRAQPQARLGACRAGHRRRRHRLGDARQHAGHARGALRRADDSARCSTPSIRGSTRRPSPSCSTMPTPRSLIGDTEFAPVLQGGADAGQGQAARRSITAISNAGSRASGSASSTTRSSSPAATRTSPGPCRRTNGTRSR